MFAAAFVMRVRWSTVGGLCQEFRDSTGSSLAFWVEDLDGEVIAGERGGSKRRHYSEPLCVGEVEVGSVWVGGKGGDSWVTLLSSVVSRELSHQWTVSDMADATARLWKHTNALMRMAASTNLSLEPAEILERTLAILKRSTRIATGVGVIRLPGQDHYTIFGADGEVQIDLVEMTPLHMVGKEVRVVTSDDTSNGLMQACARVTGTYIPTAVVALSSDSESFGFVLAPVADAEKVTSDDLKVLTSAAQIISVALENRYILSQEREATRLHVKNELLSQQTRDMEELVHIVAHDLRSPMTALYGFVHVALDEIKDMRGNLEAQGFAVGTHIENITEPLRDAIRSVEKLNRMVQRLLDFSKSARGAYTFEEIQLGKLVHGVTRSLRYQLTRNEIETEVGLLPTIIGDRVQLEAVFGNLIDNAIKYMRTDDGPRRVSIGYQSEPEPVYYVRDTGVGMTKEQIDKAFLPFQRFHTEAGPGDGIGLPHVRKIIERHGGRVWCESAVGEGSTFYFTLGSVANTGRLAASGERARKQTQLRG